MPEFGGCQQNLKAESDRFPNLSKQVLPDYYCRSSISRFPAFVEMECIAYVGKASDVGDRSLESEPEAFPRLGFLSMITAASFAPIAAGEGPGLRHYRGRSCQRVCIVRGMCGLRC